MTGTANSWFMVEIEIPDRPGSDKSGGEFFDVTSMVDTHIVVEETADLLDKLTFTLQSIDTQSVIRFIDTLTEGMRVRAWFGPMDGMKRINYDKIMFLGYIDQLEPDFGENGKPLLTIVAYDPAWKMTKTNHAVQRVFPEPKAGHSPTKISSIVKKVMEPYAGIIDIGAIEIPAGHNASITGYAPIVQNTDESDWKFLKRLAHGDEETGVGSALGTDKKKGFDGCGCLVYVELVNDRPALFFVPESNRLNVKSGIILQYPLYGDIIVTDMKWMDNSGTMQISRARIREDRQDADAVKIEVPASAFKDVLKKEEYAALTRKQTDVVVTQEEFFESFEIDFAAIKRDEKLGLIKWGSFDFFAGKIRFKDVEQYVRLKIEHVPAAQKTVMSDVPVNHDSLSEPATAFEEIKKKIGSRPKRRKGFGSAGLNMTVELKVGNHHIRPRKVYDVQGIGGKYSSSDKRKWFADVVQHTVGVTYSQQIVFTM